MVKIYRALKDGLMDRNRVGGQFVMGDDGHIMRELSVTNELIMVLSYLNVFIIDKYFKILN